MKTDNCELFVDAVLGDATESDPASAAFRKHLQDCERCRREYQEHSRISAALKESFAIRAPEGFAEGVMHAIASTRTASQEQRSVMPASAILLGISLLPLWWRRGALIYAVQQVLALLKATLGQMLLAVEGTIRAALQAGTGIALQTARVSLAPVWAGVAAGVLLGLLLCLLMAHRRDTVPAVAARRLQRLG
jgi:anti-sigma factor RsiW